MIQSNFLKTKRAFRFFFLRLINYSDNLADDNFFKLVCEYGNPMHSNRSELNTLYTKFLLVITFMATYLEFLEQIKYYQYYFTRQCSVKKKTICFA